MVTAGGTGLGLGIAKRLAEDGCVVTICGRREAVLSAATEEIGSNSRYIVCDVTHDDQVKAAVEVAAQPLGRLDITVANAGGGVAAGPLVLTDLDAWNATLALTITSTLSTIKHAAPLMSRNNGGAIVGVPCICVVERKLARHLVCWARAPCLARAGYTVNLHRIDLFAIYTVLPQYYTRIGSNKGKTPEHNQAKHTKHPHSLEFFRSTLIVLWGFSLVNSYSGVNKTSAVHSLSYTDGQTTTMQSTTVRTNPCRIR